MTFRQIIAQFSPVDCKNKLNDLLAMVERNFGVFSPDMELDIRAIISKDEIINYFDRIIHEAHPMLEHDQVQPSPKSQKQKGSKLKEEEIAARKLEKKQRKKDAKKITKRNQLSPITMDKDDYGKAKDSKRPVHLSKTDKMLQELAKNGRDYSKPTLESQISRARIAEGKDRQKPWLKIVSVPMGGQNKKY